MKLPDPDRIDQLLPQTQCRSCGYDGCAPYARAIAQGQAPVNRCPPGGQAGIERLARLTGLPALPLDPLCGVEQPRRLAWIDPQLCIGCTKCILACPVDAIIGAPKWLHAVASDLCTGCELCVAPCPVDCIHLVPADGEWTVAMADAARHRHRQRTLRLARDAQRDAQRLAARTRGIAPATPAVPAGAEAGAAHKRAMVDAAIARARQRLAQTAVPAAAADPTTDPLEPPR